LRLLDEVALTGISHGDRAFKPPQDEPEHEAHRAHEASDDRQHLDPTLLRAVPGVVRLARKLEGSGAITGCVGGFGLLQVTGRILHPEPEAPEESRAEALLLFLGDFV